MKIKKICILGGGTASWITAADLSNKFNTLGIEIQLFKSDQIGTVGVGEATLPHIRFFNNTLGIDEREFMQETCATFKLGIEFCDWGRLGDSYIDPFGDYGDPISGIDIHHFWIRLLQNGHKSRLDGYSFPILAAEAGKSQLPRKDTSQIESNFGCTYQFDSSLYTKYLPSYCADRGIQRTEGKAVETTRVPLQQRTGNGYVYCNEYISDNKAAHQLTSTLKGPALTEIKHLNF